MKVYLFMCMYIPFVLIYYISFMHFPLTHGTVGSCDSVLKLHRKRMRKNFARLKKKRGENG